MCNYLSCILVSAIAQAVSAKAGAVSHQPLTVEAQVQYQAGPGGIHGGQSTTWLKFFSEQAVRQFSCVTIIPTVLHTHASFN